MVKVKEAGVGGEHLGKMRAVEAGHPVELPEKTPDLKKGEVTSGPGEMGGVTALKSLYEGGIAFGADGFE